MVRILDVEGGIVDLTNLEKISPSQSAEFSRTVLSPGDLVCSVVGTLGETFIVPKSLSGANLSRAMARIQLRPDVCTRYVQYCMQSPEFIQFVDTNTEGAAQRVLNLGTLTELPIPVGNFNSQERIANFLDDKTARIDALIAEKERLVAALLEYESAKITAAVTRGVKSDVELVKANLAWLGEVPAHWAQNTVRRVCSRVTDGAHISPDLSSPDYNFVSTVDISEGEIRFQSCLKTSTACFEYLVKTGCRPFAGDVLFSKDGTIGRTAIVSADTPAFVVASSLVILTPLPEEVLPKYLDYWLNNHLLQQHVELLLAGAALRRISIEKVSRLPILVPPLEEQQEIVQQLEHFLHRTRQLRLHALAHIARLREYRSSLISAAVTGQLDIGTFKSAA